MRRHTRVTKDEWLARGGLTNPRLFRRHNGQRWSYWRLTD